MYINIAEIQITSSLCNNATTKAVTDAHSRKTIRRRNKKEKSRYRVTVLAAAAQPPPKQHLMSNSSKATPSRRAVPDTTN